MTVRRDRLIRLLTELDDLLARHQVAYDLVVHEICQELVAAGGSRIPSRVLARLSGMFGAMGSLTDVVIARANGHIVDDEELANRRLRELVDDIYAELARASET